MLTHNDNHFVKHLPCPSCGSSDACSLYSDGHTFCFACETYTKKDGEVYVASEQQKDLLKCDYRALNKRKLSEATCQHYRYGVSEYKGKPVQVAQYYKQGQITAQHVRFPDKNFIWLGDSKNVELFGQHLCKAGGKRLFITEGEIDCLTVFQVMGSRFASCSIPSGVQGAVKAFKNNLEFLESFEEVILCFDMDKPGQEAIQKCAMLLTPGKAKVVCLPAGYKDPNEMLVAGEVKSLVAALWDAQTYRPDGIIDGTSLRERVKKEPEVGYSSGYPLIDSMMMGIHKGKLTMITAGSGIGKSTIVHEIGYKLVQEHGLKLGVIALEESVERAAWRYMSIYLNKPIHLTRENISEADLDEAFRITVGNNRMWFYEHFGSTSLDNLMSKLKYLASGIGVDFIILDHISIVVSGLDELEDERKLIDKLMTRLRSLAEETGVGLLCIVHLKRKDKNKTFNEGGQVSLSDLRGSGALEQLSDFVIALERNQQGEDKDESQLRVLKNRHTGLVGEADKCIYNQETGRLLAQDVFKQEGETEDDF